MTKKIDNRLERTVPHTHPADEPKYSDAELRNHMVKYHGWTLGKIKQRGWSEDGAYLRGYHDNVHATD